MWREHIHRPRTQGGGDGGQSPAEMAFPCKSSMGGCSCCSSASTTPKKTSPAIKINPRALSASGCPGRQSRSVSRTRIRKNRHGNSCKNEFLTSNGFALSGHRSILEFHSPALLTKESEHPKKLFHCLFPAGRVSVAHPGTFPAWN